MTERTWKIPPERIAAIINESKEAVWEPFPGITIVALNLPNGYTIVESSGCIDPSEYSHEIGVSLCRKALERKVWQLEGYRGKQRFWEEHHED